MRPNKLKQLWQRNETAINAWLTIPSAWTAEIMAQAGFDAITIDMQHGLSDYQTTLSMLQAISTTESVPLGRVPWNEPAMIMRLLDAGVYGLICPMVNTRADAEAFVGACRYPPLGFRSYGPIRATLYAGDDYYAHANETVLTFVMVETAEALENLEEIVKTPGLDGIYVGTMDLSISLGLDALGDLNDPALREAVDKIIALTQQYQLITGVHAKSAAQVTTLSKWGFRLITPANDTNLLKQSVSKLVEQVRNPSS